MEEIKQKCLMFFDNLESFIQLPISGDFFISLILSKQEELDVITEAGIKKINEGFGFSIDLPLELSVEQCYSFFLLINVSFLRRKANYQFLKLGYIIDQFYFIDNENNEFVIFNKVPTKRTPITN